jgi:hypothetical protein
MLRMSGGRRPPHQLRPALRGRSTSANSHPLEGLDAGAGSRGNASLHADVERSRSIRRDRMSDIGANEATLSQSSDTPRKLGRSGLHRGSLSGADQPFWFLLTLRASAGTTISPNTWPTARRSCTMLPASSCREDRSRISSETRHGTCLQRLASTLSQVFLLKMTRDLA